jgi:hypothetical protein
LFVEFPIADSSNYRVVFDVLQNGFHPWQHARFGVEMTATALAVGLIIALVNRDSGRRTGLIVAVLGVTIGTLAAIGIPLKLYFEFISIRSATADGRYTTVLGRVSQFVPGDGHRAETFVVAGHHYSYRSAWTTLVFHQDSANGGPIRDNLAVRIRDFRGDIVRLEIDP